MSVDLEDRQRWNVHLFGKYSDFSDIHRSKEFWGSGIQYIFADGDLRNSIEHNPEMWRVILKDADEIFSNNSVVIYRHRAQQP